MKKEKSMKSILLTVFLIVFVDLIGYGILIPVIPLLLGDVASPYYLLSKSSNVHTGYFILGLLMAIYPLGVFLAAPILGQLSDKFGRKPILAISLLGTCISYVIFAIGIYERNIALLFISRFFDGITGGNIAVAQATIADITAPKDRAKNFGLIGAAFGLGFIIGPFIGGKLSDPAVLSWFNATTPFWFASILSFLNVISVLLILPETHKVHSSKVIDWGKSLFNISKAFSAKGLRLLFATNFLFQAGFTFFTTFFGIYLVNKFNFTQGNIGDFFAFTGIWIAFTQGFLTRKLSNIFDEQKILRFSLITTGLAILIYLVPSISWQLLLVVPFFSISNGLSQANLQGLISRSADQSIQGEVMGISSSVMALAQTIPPILSGIIASNLSPEVSIGAAGIIIVLSGILFSVGYKKNLIAKHS
ncbi:MAG: MFS transporter [Candidatus Roizmanbacteria bacterium]